MKFKSICMSILLSFVVSAGRSWAEAPMDGNWHFSGHVQAGYSIWDSSWEIRHPFYSGTGSVFWESIQGDFISQGYYSAGIEITRRWLGFQLDFGLIPMKMTNTSAGQDSEFQSYFGQISTLIFPLKDPFGRIAPYLIVGLGGFMSGGDIDNSGYLISFGGGVRCFISKKIGFDFGIKNLLMKYHQIEVASDITKDLNARSARIAGGVIFRF